MKILISCRTYRNPNGFDFDKYETGFNDMFPNDHITALLNKNQDFKTSEILGVENSKIQEISQTLNA